MMREQSKLPKSEYYTVNDRPVKIVPTSNRSKRVLVMNLRTGEFEPDMSYLSRCYNPEQDVDRLSERMFDRYVSELRNRINQEK